MIDSHVDMTSACIEWDGYVNAKGYGIESGRMAHRRAFERTIGPIPSGLVIDHLCRNRSCVNVLHLRAVTPRQNTLAAGSEAIAKVRSEQVACIHGHDFTDENTHLTKSGKRQCKECHRLAGLKRYQVKKLDSEYMARRRERNRINQRAYLARKAAT